MTYKQLKISIQAILENHAMIRRVIFDTPQEWMFKDDQPDFPLCCFAISTGQLVPGYKTFDVRFWFLDKAGREGEFEIDVVSDQLEVANDIFSLIKQSQKRDFVIDPNASYNVISDQFEDYLAGVELTVNFKTLNNYDACSVPVIS